MEHDLHVKFTPDALLDDLERALFDGEIQPAFQPIVHFPTGRVESFEVLARWTSSEHGQISPRLFVPVAERAGRIGELTAHIIRRACADSSAYGGNFAIAVNISPLQFQRGGLLETFEKITDETHFPLQRLQIEITETAVISDEVAARETIDRLRAKGVKIVLDDFGTGYSSLTRLQTLPFDKIKIDASFVRSMVDSKDSRMIVAAVIGLGHSLDTVVVAEGVETVALQSMLVDLGCDLGQGWLLGRPAPATTIPDVIALRGEYLHDIRPTDMSTSQRLAQLDAIYAVAPVGLCYVDRHLNLIKANPRFARFVNRRLEDLIGRTVRDTVPRLADELIKSQTDHHHVELRVPDAPYPDRDSPATLEITATRDEVGELTGYSIAVIGA